MKNKQGGGERDLLERVMHNRFFRGTALFVRRYFDHRVARDSAALTYYLLFAMFPLLIFLSNLVGFFAVDIEGFLRQLGTIIPAEVLDLLIQYLRYVSRVSSRTLMTFSLIFSIWFPMRAANALLLSVRKAYGMGRPTQFLRHQAKVFLYTICLILTILLSLVLVTVGRSVLNLCADYFHFSAILTDGFIELWSTRASCSSAHRLSRARRALRSRAGDAERSLRLARRAFFAHGLDGPLAAFLALCGKRGELFRHLRLHRRHHRAAAVAVSLGDHDDHGRGIQQRSDGNEDRAQLRRADTKAITRRAGSAGRTENKA